MTFETWESGDVKLILGDCLEVLPTLAAGSVDTFITDLPYGTTACSWDMIIPFEPMWKEVKRLLKPRGAFVTTASQPFTSMLVMSNLKWFKHEIIWEKSIGAHPLLCKRQPMKYHENTCVFSGSGDFIYNPIMTKGKRRDKRPTMSGRKVDENWGGSMRDIKGLENINSNYYPHSIQYFNNADQKDKTHPTQKPIALYEYLTRTYTNPGYLVCDFCFGSGTTGVACVQLGRKFIGIEIEPKYFEIAKRRIQDAQRQMIMPLFSTAERESEG